MFTYGAVTDYRLAEDHLPGRFTAREDLAACLLRQTSDRSFVNKVAAVATVAVQPSMLQLIWREGIRIRRADRPEGHAQSPVQETRAH